jgi:hypothetical protein
MGDGNFYLIGGCNGWAILLVLGAVQFFLAISLFPATIQIFDSSVSLRSARSDAEAAAKAFDSFYQFEIAITSDVPADSVGLNTFPVYSLTTYYKRSQTDESFYKAKYEYDTAKAKWQSTIQTIPGYSSFSSFNNYITNIYSSDRFLYQGVPTSLEFKNDMYYAKTADYYLVPGNTLLLSTDLRSQIRRSALEPVKLGTVDFTLRQNYSFPRNSLQEEFISNLINPGLQRGEVFAAFLIFQVFVALILFAYLLRSFAKGSAPTHASLISGIGWILFIIGWVFGYTRSNFFDLSSELRNFFQNSWLDDIVGYVVYDHLNALWIAIFTYSVYANSQGHFK